MSAPADSVPGPIVPTTDYSTVETIRRGVAIREFANMDLQASILRATSAIPSGEHVAVIPFVNSAREVKLAAVVRINSHWSAMGVFEHTPTSGQSWEVAGLWHF